MKRWMVLFCCVAVSAGAAVAQTVNGPGDDVLCSGYTPPHLPTPDQLRNQPAQKFGQPGPLPQPGHRWWPRSYRLVTQDLSILPNGTRTCRVPDVRIFYFDSSGRTREDSYFAMEGPDGKPVPMRAKIVDPVAGTLDYLDLVKHTAYRLHPPPFRPLPPVDRATQQPLPYTQNTQNLGSRTFEGFPVEGTLQTFSGTPPGGTQPISSTTERWTVHYGEGGTTLLTKTSNTTMQQTQALLDFSTAEPDPALFRVPDGWNIVEMK